MKKKAFITRQKAQEIAQEYGTPYYIYDEAGLRAKARDVVSAFAWNDGFVEYFAVKAEPNPYIMSIFREYGIGADCSSMTELHLADAVGYSGHEIMFSSNNTPAEEFAQAERLGAIINLDDITHIELVHRTLGYMPKTMSCRYNPGGVFTMSNEIMDNPGESKYGMTPQQIVQAISRMKELGVEHFGIHAFLASNTKTNDYYGTLAGILFAEALRIRQETGVQIEFINLSGGVGIDYHPDDVANDIYAVSAGVKQRYDEILVPAGMGDVRLCAEMGRFMTGPHGALVTKVTHEKHIYKEYLGCDACAVNLMRPAMYGAYHHITVLGREDDACDCTYDVVGSLCENNDKFAIDRKMPRTQIGDLLFIHDAGAHGFSMGYSYNGKLKCPELLLREDGSVQMIRRGETQRDYFATFDFSDEYGELGR